jgi:hypothetical protein
MGGRNTEDVWPKRRRNRGPQDPERFKDEDWRKLILPRQHRFPNGENGGCLPDGGDGICEEIQNIFQERRGRWNRQFFTLSQPSCCFDLTPVGSDDFGRVKLDELGVRAEKPAGKKFTRKAMEVILFQSLKVGEGNSGSLGNVFKGNLFFFSLPLKALTYRQTHLNHFSLTSRESLI